MRRRLILLMMLLVPLAGLLAACGGSEESSTTAADTAAAGGTSASGDTSPLVIGIAGAKTGWMAPYDAATMVGAELAAEDINAKGGVNGRQIKLITADSKTDPAVAGQAAAKLLDDGAEVLMATCDYDMGAPIAQAGEAAGVVTAGCAGALQWGAQGLGPLTYNFYPGSATEGRLMAGLATEKGYKNPFVLTLTDLAYTKTMCEYFDKAWKEDGGKIAGSDTLAGTDAAIDTQIANIRSSGADSIVICSLPPSGATAIKQIRAAGIDLPLVLASAYDGDYWLEAVPDLSDAYYAAIGSVFGDDPNPVHQELFDRYKEKTGKRADLSAYFLIGYAQVEAIAKGVEIAGTAEGTKLAAALDTFVDEPLATGNTTYTPTCHIPQTLPHLVLEIKDGKVSSTGEVITPTADPDAPC